MPSQFWYAAAIAVVVLTLAGWWFYLPTAAPTVAIVDHPLPSDDPQLGRRVYVRCQACHGLHGEGVAGNYPPLAGSGVLSTDRAVQLVLVGAARGPGWNGQMPAFAEQLADHEIAAVLTWARQQWGNTGAVVTPNDVARLRR